MVSYSRELKEQIVRKMMPPNPQSVAAISRETGISAPTLYAWKKQFRNQGHVVPGKPTSPDRWDAKARLATVIQLALMNEAERSAWCREHGLYVEQVDAWKQAFETMEPTDTAASRTDAAATRRQVRQLQKELQRKEKALAEAAALLTLSKKSPGHLGHRRGRLIPESMKQMAISLIDEAVKSGARQHKACAVLGITCRTLRRWREADDLADRRKGAAKHCPHALTEAERAEILEVCNQPEFRSLPPSQIVPYLADQGIYLASEATLYRVLADAQQAQRRGRAAPPRSVAKPKAHAATAPNRVWSWDITYLPTAIKGQFHRLYLVMDIYSRKIVGWEVHAEELAEHAAELVTKACLREQVARGLLVLHADNGSPMKGATMLATLQMLGVVPSFSRPSVSDDNPYSEALFRTLKYTPAYPGEPFADIDAARAWVARFVDWYNHEHRHSAIRFVTPAERHAGQDKPILAARTGVYEAAKERHPHRWRGRAVRNWKPIDIVWLNPDKRDKKIPANPPSAA